MPDPRGWILGIDVGGTGSRALLQRVDGTDRRTFVGDRARATSAGTRALDVAAHLAHEARVACDDHPLLGVGIGATGLATLLSTPEDALRDLANALDAPVAAATDAYTAHLGALGGRGGAVLSLGTGAVAFATDHDRLARRLDGWGHLYGDRGSGARIGMAALESAALAHDGVDPRGGRLLEAMRAALGEVDAWPAGLYLADDRAGRLASLVPAVARLATAGDEEAQRILDEAARDAARTLVAALAAPTPPLAAVTGGLRGLGPGLEASIAAVVRAARPDVEIVPAAGDPVDGALLLAEHAALGRVARVPGCWHARAPRRHAARAAAR